jgi:hypothetical protein
MANEFKIKKGLIVTGASGGTVVDIQGSQGQLFSVTDDLSGSIFAVSDISGVPIFDVNSSGLSTFDGLVSGITPVNAANFVTKAYVDGSGGGTGPFLPLAGGTLSGALAGTSATFTGNISALGGSFTDPVTIYDSTISENPRLSVGRNAGEAIQFDVTDRVATIRHKNDSDSNQPHDLDFIIDTPSSGNKIFNFGVAGNTTSTYLTIDSTGATFAGDVTLTGGALSISGDGSNAVSFTETGAGKMTVSAADDIVLDAGSDIVLDAGGDDLRLKVSGTEYAKFNNSSSNLNIFSSIQDKAIKFIGNDNGTEITALTLNMADGGDATFAGDITTPSGIITSLGGNNMTIASTAANHGGLSFGTNVIYPSTPTATNDNVFDLGGTAERFKNLYLGGSLYGNYATGTISTNVLAFTQANAINNTTIATTAYVNNKIGEIPAGLRFEGTWDARTVAEGGTGTPPSASPANGQFWIVSVAGSTSLSGITDWKVGDWAIYVVAGAGTDGWQKVDNSSVLDGSGTGNQSAKWAGSGTSNTLTNGSIEDEGTILDAIRINSTSDTTKNYIGMGRDSTNNQRLSLAEADSNGSHIRMVNSRSGGGYFVVGVGDTNSSSNIVPPGGMFFYNGTTRMVINSSGNVGIGTTSPDAKLDVHSSINISNPTSTINEVADLNLRTYSSNWGYRQTKISSTLLNTTTGNNRLDFTIADASVTGGNIVAMSILSAGGNVGIGVIDPQAKLEVKGISATPGDGNEIISVTNTLGGSKLLLGVVENSYGWIQSAEGATLRNLLLNPLGGNVGIATSTPTNYRLQVGGTVESSAFSVEGASARIFAPSGANYNGSGSQTGYLIAKLPDNGASGLNNMMTGVIRVFDYTGNESFDVHFAGYWYSGYNWTNCSAWIDSQANVDRNFTVRWGATTGSAGANTRPYISIGDATSTWTYVKFSVINFEPGHSNYEAYKWDSGWNMDLSTTLPGGSLRDTSTTQSNNWARNGQDLYYGSGTGNVGIGVTGPTRKLSVENSSSSIIADFKYSAAGYSSIDLSNNTSFARLSSVNSDLLLSPAGSEKMRVTNSGQVNIATPITNAFYGLSLQYNSLDTAEFKVNQATGQIKIGGVATGYYPTFYSAGSEKMRITTGGNVGIGTTTPLAKLDIQGTQGQLFSVTDDLSGSIFAVSDISGVPIFDVNSSGVSYFDGNVGIGTETPDGKLEIASNTSLSSYVTQYTNDADGAELVIRTARGTESTPIQYSTNDSAGRLLFQAYTSSGAFKDAASIESVMESGSANAYGGLRFNYMPTTSPYVLTEGMRLKANGNVGIGTIPDTKLHVAGNIRATGQTLYLSTSSTFNKIALNGTDMEIWSGSLSAAITINNSGLLKFGNYGLSGGGTATSVLGLDSSGNVVKATTFSTPIADQPAAAAVASGTIVNWTVSESTTVGLLYVVKTTGGWTTADADSEARSIGMLAIALSTDADEGMLLQGFFYKSAHGFTIGLPLYISNTSGAFTNTRPTGANDYVRIIGYATSANYIYFDPDKTWVQIA